MFLIDDLLALPVRESNSFCALCSRSPKSSIRILRPGKRRLLELQLALESGEITEQEYVRQEAEILRELREIENRKRRMAGAEPEEAPALPQFEIESALGHDSPKQSGVPARKKADEKAR